MKRRRVHVVLAAVALTATAVSAAAHDLFIKLDSYRAPAHTPIRIPILNGTFQGSENSITADRVADVSVVVDGRRSHPGFDGWHAEGDTTFLDIRTGEAGTYVLGVSTRPNDLSLSADDFNLYLASDGVVDVLRQRALDGELGMGARERYSKHVKAVLQVGERVSSRVDAVLGYPAEVVPLDNPYASSVGDVVRFRILVDGAPVAGQLVLAGGARGTHVIDEREGRSDRDGIVRFTLDEPGVWYVKFINMRKVDAEGLDYESKWATLTFEVR